MPLKGLVAEVRAWTLKGAAEYQSQFDAHLATVASQSLEYGSECVSDFFGPTVSFAVVGSEAEVEQAYASLPLRARWNARFFRVGEGVEVEH